MERKLIGAEGVAFDLTMPQRTILGGRVIWFYLGKLAWPANLVFFYPRWSLAAADAAQWIPLLAAIAGTFVAWRLRHRSGRRSRCGCCAWVRCYRARLFNVYPFQYSFVADHFFYLPSLAIVAAGAALLIGAGDVVIAGALAALLVLTLQQSRIYRDSPTLYRAVLARNPDSWIAHNNLGKEMLGDKTQLPTAIAHFERAIALRGDYAEAEDNLGLALTQSGRPREAIAHHEHFAVAEAGRVSDAQQPWHCVREQRSRRDAMREFSRAAALNPGLPNIEENWAKALILLGRRDEAQGHLRARRNCGLSHGQ